MKYKSIPAKVRKALGEGNIRDANRMLRTLYSISGIVVKGQQLGRELGFPTANLKLNLDIPLFLANGVYAAQVRLDTIKHLGMVNIGIRPTLNQHELTVEVNIFDFDEDIYGREISIHFVERIRDEQKFNSLEELKKQIEKDKIRVPEILSAGM
jgi:riboflavin kinase / FMN adenylyltransferase